MDSLLSDKKILIFVIINKAKRRVTTPSVMRTTCSTVQILTGEMVTAEAAGDEDRRGAPQPMIADFMAGIPGGLHCLHMMLLPAMQGVQCDGPCMPFPLCGCWVLLTRRYMILKSEINIRIGIRAVKDKKQGAEKNMRLAKQFRQTATKLLHVLNTSVIFACYK